MRPTATYEERNTIFQEGYASYANKQQTKMKPNLEYKQWLLKNITTKGNIQKIVAGLQQGQVTAVSDVSFNHQTGTAS